MTGLSTSARGTGGACVDCSRSVNVWLPPGVVADVLAVAVAKADERAALIIWTWGGERWTAVKFWKWNLGCGRPPPFFPFVGHPTVSAACVLSLTEQATQARATHPRPLVFVPSFPPRPLMSVIPTHPRRRRRRRFVR